MTAEDLGLELFLRRERQSKVQRGVEGLLRFARAQPLGFAGGFIVVALLLMAVLAKPISPYGYDEQVYSDTLQGPSLRHPFGTDDLGRDLFSRIAYGAQISMVIGFGAVTVSIVIAVLVGGISGFRGGVTDMVAQRFVEIVQAFPALILLISIISIIGQDRWQIALALGALSSVGASRVMRGAVMNIKNNVYFDAARSLGATDFRIFWRYVIPNTMATIIVLATIQLGSVILAEASLSFLGYGVQPPFPTWGRLLSGVARSYIVENPWMGLWPGLFIALAVFGFNMLGDALRDVLDPRLRGSR